MSRLLQKWLVFSLVMLAGAVMLSAPARAATCPLPVVFGQVLTADQWNACLNLGANALPITGGTMTGKLTTVASATGSAGFNIPTGVQPTSGVNGDMYSNNSGLFVFINGSWINVAPSTGPLSATGSPSTNEITIFSSSSTVTNGNLSGDCSTSNNLTLTCTQLRGGNVSVPNVTDTIAMLGQNQSFGASQRAAVSTITPSGSTFTPNFNSGQNFSATLVHGSPNTLANPSTTPVAGQAGTLEVIQSSSGGDTIGTWGSDYISTGGTATITLSTGANNIDVFSYYVIDSTHIVLSPGVLNVSH